jgi:hypothetical protein
MKQMFVVLLATTVYLGVATVVRGQMGGDWFKQAGIVQVINPVVGKGGIYETTRNDQQNAPKASQELTVVAKDSVNGKEAYWLEIGDQDEKTGQMGYGKVLFTKEDFQFHRVIVQRPGQQALEMPFNPSDSTKKKVSEEIEKWHVVGTESITVPAGTFSCQHWKKEKTSEESAETELWTSDKVTPFGIVKQVGAEGTMVLMKVITDATDHITGPVRKFDPLEIKRQLMEKMQQTQQQNQPPRP